MFLSWRELLGYEMFYIPEDEEDMYGAAAYYLHELSWFGYNKKAVRKNLRKEKSKLKKAVKESKDPKNLKKLDIDELYKEFNIEPPTPEEIELRNKLMEEVIVKSYNEKIRIYNKYFIGDYFNDNSR